MSYQRNSRTMSETVECGWCEEEVPVEETEEREDNFFGGTFRVCKKCIEGDR